MSEFTSVACKPRARQVCWLVLNGIAWLILIIASRAIPAAEKATAPGASSVALRYGIKIPLRDGIHLNANLFLPAQPASPQPAVFVLTPYTTDRYYIDDCIYYARNGYACAVVDVRGRGDSQGQFLPFETDGRDGYDVVEWLARQPWCDGKVAMFGFSYSGFAQWTVLKELPPHLATIVPTASVYPGYDFPLSPGNLFQQWIIRWLTATSGAAAGSNLTANEEFWAGRLQELYVGKHSFAQSDAVSGNLSTVFQKWMTHPYPDAYWNALVPTAALYSQIHIPVLTITGDYDADQLGALRYYREHMSHGSADSTSRHYLVIGPWSHLLTHKPETQFEGLKFDHASLVDMHLLHKQWFDWVMKQGPRPDFLRQRVAYYVAGQEQWHYADRLEDIGKHGRTFYLSSQGRADDVFHAGTLDEHNREGAAFDSYTDDPASFSPRAPEQARKYVFDCPTAGPDQDLTNPCDAMGIQGNGLIYHTAPFTEDLQISGAVKVALWLQLDVPDADFMLNLDEVRLDGSIIHLADTTGRARYRLSPTEEHLVEPGKPQRYDFATFQFIARRISPGSRLRLTLTPPTPDFERNYHTGKPVEHETLDTAIVAHIRLYHDKRHPSTLEIPVE